MILNNKIDVATMVMVMVAEPSGRWFLFNSPAARGAAEQGRKVKYLPHRMYYVLCRLYHVLYRMHYVPYSMYYVLYHKCKYA